MSAAEVMGLSEPPAAHICFIVSCPLLVCYTATATVQQR
jgi:hypothetical protein